MRSRTSRLRNAGLLMALAGLATLAGACSSDPASNASTAPAPQVVSELHDRLPQHVKESGVLRVGTNGSYAPITSHGPDGRTMVGMEPDLATEIGLVLGVRLEFVIVPFSDIIPKVATGSLDVGMSAITDTPQRSALTDFVNYFNAGTSILVQRGNPAGVKELTDLCGKRVAAEQGTVQVELVQRTQDQCAGHPIDLRTYPTNNDALVELRTGRAAAVLNDYPPAAHLLADARTRPYYELASTTQYEPGLYGMAVHKEQPELRDALQAAVALLVRNGTYAKVLQAWDLMPGAVSTITVNSGR